MSPKTPPPPSVSAPPPPPDEFRLSVAGHVFVARLPYIERGDEPYLDHSVGKRLEHAVAYRLCELGDTSAAAFRFMRKAMGLRITDLSDLLDVSPETVKAWEDAVQPVTRAAWAVLAALISDALAGRSVTSSLLKAAKSPRSAPEEVHVSIDEAP